MRRATLGFAGLVAIAGLAVSQAAGVAAPGATARAAGQRPAALHVSAVGDTILGNTPVLPPHPRRWLHQVKRPLRHGADLVYGNLEGTLTTQTQNKCGASLGTTCFAFRNPPHYAKFLAADGFSILGDANNHSHDFGSAGLKQTRQSISAAGMKHTGMPGEIAYKKSHGIRTGVVAFAPYSNTADMLDLGTAARLVRKARRHADLVVVYMHAGAEGADKQHVTGHEEYYLGEDRGNPERFAHRMVRAGANLVIASGPHVLRGMEFYRGRLIAYSLGNFANYKNFASSGVLAKSAILRVSIGPNGRFRGGRVVPVLLGSNGHPTRGGNSVAIIRRLSREDFGSHAALLSRKGRISKP